MTTIADLRREYASRALTESDAHDDPMRQFGLWFEEAHGAGTRERWETCYEV